MNKKLYFREFNKSKYSPWKQYKKSYTAKFQNSRHLHIYVHICSFYKSSFQISIFRFLNSEGHGKCPCIELTQKCYWCNCNINWTCQDTRKIFGKLVTALTSRKLIKDATLLIFSKVKPLRLLHLGWGFLHFQQQLLDSSSHDSKDKSLLRSCK